MKLMFASDIHGSRSAMRSDAGARTEPKGRSA